MQPRPVRRIAPTSNPTIIGTALELKRATATYKRDHDTTTHFSASPTIHGTARLRPHPRRPARTARQPKTRRCRRRTINRPPAPQRSTRTPRKPKNRDATSSAHAVCRSTTPDDQPVTPDRSVAHREENRIASGRDGTLPVDLHISAVASQKSRGIIETRRRRIKRINGCSIGNYVARRRYVTEYAPECPRARRGCCRSRPTCPCRRRRAGKRPWRPVCRPARVPGAGYRDPRPAARRAPRSRGA